MYFITQCVDEKDFKLMLIIMIPLFFLPFVTKHFSHYFLLAPFILMNLAPGYGYANDYGFQYVFGTTTCLIYAAMINYAELKGKHKEFLPPCCSFLRWWAAMWVPRNCTTTIGNDMTSRTN